MSKAVDATHLSLLVGGRKYAARANLTSDRLNKVLPVLRTNVFTQLGKQLRGPFPLDLGWLCVKLVLALSLFVGTHSAIIVFVKLAFARLQVEPREGESANVWQQSLDELALLILRKENAFVNRHRQVAEQQPMQMYTRCVLREPYRVAILTVLNSLASSATLTAAEDDLGNSVGITEVQLDTSGMLIVYQ